MSRSDKMDGEPYIEVRDINKLARKTVLRPPGFANQRQTFVPISKTRFVIGYDANYNCLLWRIGQNKSINLGVSYWSTRVFKRSDKDFIVGVMSQITHPEDGTSLPLMTWKVEAKPTKTEIVVKAPEGFDLVCGGNFTDAEPQFDISPDGSLGAVAIYKKTSQLDSDLLHQHILIFDGKSGLPLRTIKVAESNQLVDFMFTPNGKLAITKNKLVNEARSLRSAIQIWDPHSGNAVVNFQNSARCTVFVFSPNGAYLATGGDQRKILLWDAQSGKLLRTFQMPEARNWTVFFSPDNSTLATFDGYHKLIFWPLR